MRLHIVWKATKNVLKSLQTFSPIARNPVKWVFLSDFQTLCRVANEFAMTWINAGFFVVLQAHSGGGGAGGGSSSSSASLPTTLSSLLPPSSVSASATSTSSPSAASSSGVPITGPPPTTTSGSNGQGVDLSQATAMANVIFKKWFFKLSQIFIGFLFCIYSNYSCTTTCRRWQQRVWATPKNEKSVPFATKHCMIDLHGTAIWESTRVSDKCWKFFGRTFENWFFSPRVSGEKPYPCRFCGRRFRTNYNKLGHEKKCPDRHSRAIAQPQPVTGTGQTENVVYR